MLSGPAVNSAIISRTDSVCRRSAVTNRLFAAVLLLALSVVTTTAANAENSICGGTRIPIDTSVLSEPFANLSLGGNKGNFLIDTGATQSQVDRHRYGVPEGSKIFLSEPLYRWCRVACSLRPICAPLRPLAVKSGSRRNRFLEFVVNRISLRTAATIRRAGEESMRPDHTASRWFYRGRFTGLL